MCDFCKETKLIDSVSFNPSNWIESGEITSIESLVRLDIRPEDDIYQIDCQVIAVNSLDNVYGDWYSTPVDINFCPMCGKNLKKGV